MGNSRKHPAVSEYCELPEINPTEIAVDQVVEAQFHLDRHPSSFVRWPFVELNALTGPMGPGEVWYVCAFSGGGKTTFVGSAIDGWQRAGRRVYVMPLEIQPWRFRTYLACMKLGIHPGDALSGQLRAMPNGEEMRAAIKSELTAQSKSPYVDQVMIDEQRAINICGLEKGLQRAKAFRADVVIIDHIDHVEPLGGQSTNGYADAQAVNHAALRMAQDNDLLIVSTSQLNNEIVARGQDRLARYQPPREHHVLMGGKKREVATGMIGLYRPTRAKRDDETPEEYAAILKAVRAGLKEPRSVLELDTIGVNAMKLRNYGNREGQCIKLAFRHGRVEDLKEADRWSTAHGHPRKVV